MSNGDAQPNYFLNTAQPHPYHILYPVALTGTNWVDYHRMHPKPLLTLRKQPAMSLELLLRLLRERIVPELGVVRKTMVLMGASMGGYGVWDVLLRYPTMFGSAVPICGGGDYVATERLDGCRRANTRVWAFHSRTDGIVHVNASRQMFRALAERSSHPGAMVSERQVRGKRGSVLYRSPNGDLRYTEFDSGKHQQSAGLAWAEPELHRWLWNFSSESVTGSGNGTDG